jgi:hypothetical protein
MGERTLMTGATLRFSENGIEERLIHVPLFMLETTGSPCSPTSFFASARFRYPRKPGSFIAQRATILIITDGTGVFERCCT